MIFNAYAEQKETVGGLSLVSCGHIFAKNGREIYRPNGRDDWLLFYIAKETETFHLNRTVTGNAGAFVLFAPGERQHHIYTGDKTAEFYYVHFKCETLPDNITLKTSRLYQLPFKRQICDTFEEIIDEILKKQPFSERLCIYKLFHLLTELEREVFHANRPETENFYRIARAIQHMNRHYTDNLSLAEYAAICNMSKYHFLRVFKETVGSTPLEYRNRIRLEHAAELLQEEKSSVEEVASMLGYSSASYFSSVFKAKFGLSPKQYQQKYKK
ncbi:MAG: helix-turn-helix transcriptional regulator [Clostridia bacterium]|nr:helix-turn-helix transcriptional regulator [Clostridia bacterium]